jgi:hypothetical protein
VNDKLLKEITNTMMTNSVRMIQISVSFNSPLPFLSLEVASVVFIGVSFEARYLRNLF